MKEFDHRRARQLLEEVIIEKRRMHRKGKNLFIDILNNKQPSTSLRIFSSSELRQAFAAYLIGRTKLHPESVDFSDIYGMSDDKIHLFLRKDTALMEEYLASYDQWRREHFTGE